MTPDRRPQFLGEPFHDIHRTRQLAFPRVSDPRGRVRKRKRANGKHSGFYASVSRVAVSLFCLL